MPPKKKPAKPAGPRRFPKTTLDEVAGCLKYKGKPVTLAEMDAAIAREVLQRHKLGRY
jgi:hypothetical protein